MSGIIADTNAPVMGSDWYKVIEGLPWLMTSLIQ